MHKLFFVWLISFIGIANLTCSKDSSNSSSNPKIGVTGEGGSMARFTILGNYLYTVDDKKLKIFSLADPANPLFKNSVDVGFGIETIYPFKDKLFIGSSSAVYIFSISDPENPQKLSTAISPNVIRRCDPVVAKDLVAYATLRTNGPCGGVQSQLVTFDISDITNPIQKSSYSVGEPYGLGYSDTVLYVCDRYSLLVFNIKNVYNPQFIKQISGNWYMDVIPYYNTLICWVSDGVVLYDISNPASPQFITKIT